MRRTVVFTIILILANCNPPSKLAIPSDSHVIFKLVNDLRVRHGLLPLRYLQSKQAEVDVWARRLEKDYRHAGRGYTCENIAYNMEGPEMLFDQWLNSPPHRRNMLSRRIRYCTVSVHVGSHKGRYPTYYGVFRGYEISHKAVKKFPY